VSVTIEGLISNQTGYRQTTVDVLGRIKIEEYDGLGRLSNAITQRVILKYNTNTKIQKVERLSPIIQKSMPHRAMRLILSTTKKKLVIKRQTIACILIMKIQKRLKVL